MICQAAVLLGIILQTGLGPYGQLLCAVFQQLFPPLSAAHIPLSVMAGGQRLSARRKQLRLTQEEVADLADMATQTISTAENGIKALRPANIMKLCGALNISADYLLFGTITSDRRCKSLRDRHIPFAPRVVPALNPTGLRPDHGVGSPL